MSGSDPIRSATEADERLRELLANATLPMWVFEPNELRFLLVNDAAIERYGYSRAEFAAMSVPEIREGADVEAARRFIVSQPLTELSAGDWRHVAKDGSVIWADVRVFPVSYQGRACFCAISQPVAERKRIEDELQPLWDYATPIPDVVGQRAVVIDADLVAANDCAHALRGIGLETAVVSEAWEALDAIKLVERDLALVTIDVTMPEGSELLQTVRERWPTVPVVITTAFGPQQALNFLARGSHIWTVRKPLTTRHLARVASAALEESRQPELAR